MDKWTSWTAVPGKIQNMSCVLCAVCMLGGGCGNERKMRGECWRGDSPLFSHLATLRLGRPQQQCIACIVGVTRTREMVGSMNHKLSCNLEAFMNQEPILCASEAVFSKLLCVGMETFDLHELILCVSEVGLS